MRHGFPGMTAERFALLEKERARERGEDVTFTAAEIAMLHEEAAHANAVLAPDELRSIYGPQEPDPDAEGA